MHDEILPPGALALIDRLADDYPPELGGWTLAGETGLALHLGHCDPAHPSRSRRWCSAMKIARRAS